MLKQLLAFFGYYKIDYGYSTGRHWIEINDVIFYQGIQYKQYENLELGLTDIQVFILTKLILKDNCVWNFHGDDRLERM